MIDAIFRNQSIKAIWSISNHRGVLFSNTFWNPECYRSSRKTGRLEDWGNSFEMSSYRFFLAGFFVFGYDDDLNGINCWNISNYPEAPRRQPWPRCEMLMGRVNVSLSADSVKENPRASLNSPNSQRIPKMAETCLLTTCAASAPPSRTGGKQHLILFVHFSFLFFSFLLQYRLIRTSSTRAR